MNTFPLKNEELKELVKKYPTPFYLYDEKGIVENIRYFKKAFSIFPKFREFFAVKACPNPYIMRILEKEGCGADCSSLPELILAQKSGMTGHMVMFTSNDTPAEEFILAAKQGNIINFDDITHVEFVRNALGGTLPDTVCFRYNPGSEKHGGNSIIGKPEEAKYGLTKEQMIEGYKLCKKYGVKHFGLHTMVASNELNPDFFTDTARIVFDMVLLVQKEVGINIEFVDLGGGVGIPYKPEQKKVDLEYVAKEIRKLYDKMIVPAGLDPMGISFECGRPITGPYGWLVTTAIHEKHIYRDYIGCDACMADLMRPGMYGAWHGITVSGKEDAPADHVYDVTGSLCENCDKFAVQRSLPKIDKGDLLIIHDAGAHGRSMGFNYNGKLRAGELLLRSDGSVMQIRRRETVEDYFATLDFAGLDSFKA